MTKMEKLTSIFTKKPDTSIEDAMRRVGASRPLAYKARQQARAYLLEAERIEATAKGAKKKLIIHKSEAEMAKRLGIPLDRYAAHAAEIEDEEELQNEYDQITDTLSARGEKYGPFIGHAEISRALKNVLRFYTVERKGSWQTLDADMAEALEMIAHKMARIINGDQNHTDSWVDIAGYAKLVADRLQGVTR